MSYEVIIDVSNIEHRSFDFKRMFDESIPCKERIVRCRDCKHYDDGTVNGRRCFEPHCDAIGELSFGALFEVTEDDFCSWGERKMDAHAERQRGEGERHDGFESAGWEDRRGH